VPREGVHGEEGVRGNAEGMGGRCGGRREAEKRDASAGVEGTDLAGGEHDDTHRGNDSRTHRGVRAGRVGGVRSWARGEVRVAGAQGFDEYMNVVLDDAVELDLRRKERSRLGRILLRGDTITLVSMPELGKPSVDE
jgi:hypothetical protein